MPSDFVVKNARYLLLTYAQANDVDPFNILTCISERGAECIIAREFHDDGGLHFHVLCHWEKPYSVRSTTAFDVDGKHPNIERVGRTPRKVWDYVTKDGDVVYGGLECPPADGSNENRDRRVWEGEYTSKWAYIVDAADKDEFFARLQAEDPRSLACNYPSITKYVDWKYRTVPEEYCHPSNWQFNLDGAPELNSWMSESLCDNCTLDR